MKRKILISFFAMIFLIGVWGAFTRKGPIEKNIGYTYLSDGEKTVSLDGYKVSSYMNGKNKKYNYPDIQSKKNNLNKVNVSKENSNNMTLSYSKEHYGDVTYSLYDSEFNVILDNENALTVPGDADSLYYVSVLVSWGSEKQNVSMVYYFSIQTE